MNWFEQQSIQGTALKPMAAPAHFGSPYRKSHWELDTKALLKTERAWYEFLGRLWALIKS